MRVTCWMDIKITSVNKSRYANRHERASVVKRQKEAAYRHVLSVRQTIRPSVLVTLTRVGPRPLDDDNLSASLKAVRDGVAKCLRIDDATALVEWRYLQYRRGMDYGVSVCIEDMPGGAGGDET